MKSLLFYLVKLFGGVLLFLSLFIPVKRYSPVNTYVFNVTYVNGHNRNITLELPHDFEYAVQSNKGSYYLEIWSVGKTIWGYKTFIEYPEYNHISGILYVNSITKK